MENHILAVDDEIHMLRLLEDIITRKTPYRIVTTHNALEVPELLEERRFDLIITDLRMPGLSGLDVLRLVREKGRQEQVIIITAFGSLESAVEALELGVFDYITKPFRKERLLASVRRAMQAQVVRSRIDKLDAMLEAEPFDKAAGLFKKAYLEALAGRTEADRDEMVVRSGLSRSAIDGLFVNENKD
jgi:DNA-binding NtrC family response regulator